MSQKCRATEEDRTIASEIIERDLYNGLFHMVHNPNAKGRAPRYKVNDELKPKGVTTILGGTLAKDFVNWALECMAEYLQGKLPVVTQEDLDEAKKASARKRDSGASTGTEAHTLVENYLKGNNIAPASIEAYAKASDEAKKAYDAFTKWFEDVTPEVINVEEVIFSKSCEYAGTYDCMLRIDGKVWLCDLKTTNVSRRAPNGVYAENFLQLGAYAGAHEEQRLYEIAHEGTELAEIDGLMVISAKKNGKLDIVTNEDVGLSLLSCMELFLLVFTIYKFMADTTKALGGK